jgi:hypothetical protein
MARPQKMPTLDELRKAARHAERAVWKAPGPADRDDMIVTRDILGLKRDIYAETVKATGIDPQHPTPALTTVHLP